jgi:hypothetical protein
MKGVIALLALFGIMTGCGVSYTVRVPRTPDGMSCARECQRTHNQCALPCSWQFGLGKVVCYDDCADQETQCWATCPGAYWTKQ